MIVKYIAGNSGREYILNQMYEINIEECNPHSVEWVAQETEERWGTRITAFTKKPIALDITFKFRGSAESIAENLNDFFADAERDILALKEGRLYVGEYYLSGYFISRSTAPAMEYYGCRLTTVFYSPYPFWVKEDNKGIFTPTGETEETKAYEYDYMTDYAKDMGVYGYVDNDEVEPADFLLTIYGRAENPYIEIGGNIYQVNISIGDGERIEINSYAKTLTLYDMHGTPENIFYARNLENYIFEKIPVGRNKVEAGNYSWSLVLYERRSEPRWLTPEEV